MEPGRPRRAAASGEPVPPRSWGSLARKGARSFRHEDRPSASGEWRAAVVRARGDEQGESGPPPRWEPEEVWVIDDQDQASEAGSRRSRPTPRRRVPRPVVDELSASAGSRRGAVLAERLAEASHAYDHERYGEARNLLRPLLAATPDAPAVRELHGLTLYRLGRWREAARDLEEYRRATGSFDQHPVLADCYRALHRYQEVEELWEELRQASPSAELVAEGRIVAAGALADQGQIARAIQLLERGRHPVRHPAEHHLRQWYALADLYERAGELPRARDLFARVAGVDRDAFDVRERLKALR